MKNKILVIVFIVYISLFSLVSIILPDKEISNSERRKLKDFPEFEFDSEWISKLDSYLLDHVVLRDELRSIKALYNYKVLKRLDNNGIYLKDNYIFKSNYPTNKKSINNFVRKINKLSNDFSKNNNVYLMVIPDKNYYLESNDFLNIDYDYIYKEVKKLGFKNIEVRDLLELDDYYETDTHWRQERLENVVRTINKSMGNETSFNYKENKYEPFYGVYYGHAALKLKGDVLTYLTNDTLDKVIVEDIEGNNKLYDIDSLDGLDSYDVFVGGSTPLVKITNPNSKSKKELIMFRDSFGSSLAPLLVENYKSVTLVDMRYMTMDVLKEKVDFNNKDILIIYNTLLVNESNTLKIW